MPFEGEARQRKNSNSLNRCNYVSNQVSVPVLTAPARDPILVLPPTQSTNQQVSVNQLANSEDNVATSGEENNEEKNTPEKIPEDMLRAWDVSSSPATQHGEDNLEKDDSSIPSLSLSCEEGQTDAEIQEQ